MFVLSAEGLLFATVPPRGGGPMPEAYLQRLKANPSAFAYKRALIPLTEKVLLARVASTMRAAVAEGGVDPSFTVESLSAFVRAIRFVFHKDYRDTPYPCSSFEIPGHQIGA
jgi:hypothetical protein